MNTFTRTMLVAIVTCMWAGNLFALDLYLGDSSIYRGDTGSGPKPNVLFIIDNSNSAANPASSNPYDPSFDYSTTTSVSPAKGRYDIWKAGQQGEFTQLAVSNASSSMTNLLCTNNSNVIRTTLNTYGTYTANATADYPSLHSNNGTCVTNKAYTYAIGNYINYLNTPSGNSDSQSKIIYDAISQVVGGARAAFNFGAMVYKETGNKGGKIISPMGSLLDNTAFSTFLAKIPGSGNAQAEGLLSSQTARPQAEALLDAGYYFRGLDLPVGGQSAMASPIVNHCDKSTIILITNGLSNKDDDGDLATIVGDYDNDGAEASAYGLGTHYLDDVAKYLYETDASNLTGTQRINTHTILAFQANDTLLQRAADISHGRGTYSVATNQAQIATALNNILVALLAEVDTAFVAPVVPASPENRTYSGQRVYLGFFFPKNEAPWHGNLKKFAIGDYVNNAGVTIRNAILDKNGAPATNSDGSFLDTADSFWSTDDGGIVSKGGVGGLLISRGFTSDVVTDTNRRNIYTYLTPTNSAVGSANSALTNTQNRFVSDNANILYNTTLGVVDTTERTKLIKFIHGLDTYDDDLDGSTTDMRGDNPETAEDESWALGDILHSKPLVVNYATYTFNSTNEANCNMNKDVVYFGANDGMLHAVKDCDGQELWAFIPPDFLTDLQQLRTQSLTNKHPIFADGTPIVYKYDADNDGNIEPAQGDKVIMVFGVRRNSSAYYALDVTDSAAPVYLWKIDQNTAGFSELGESWSSPVLGKIKDSSGNIKIVAFIGGGYDNNNEDGRFGATQGFTNANVVLTTNSDGSVTNTANITPVRAGTTDLTNAPRGRGVYAFRLATLTNGVPTIQSSPALEWSYTHDAGDTTRKKLDYSFPTDITVLDTDYDGFVDRLYAGDTGGNMWRFGQTTANVNKNVFSSWTGIRIFSANGSVRESASDVGRKIFYRPSVTLEIGGQVNIYFGSGDREHPLNTAVVDRMYAVFDKGQSTADEIDEDNLEDVTLNLLQTANPTETPANLANCTASNTSIGCTLERLKSANNYGWYIKLNESGHDPGEKILAQPLVFNKVAYYTSYAPLTSANASPCDPGNLGTSRLYAVDYLTGEAVLNFNSAAKNPSGHNDNESTSNNARASDGQGHVLRRSDRSVTLGVGIPSGIVIVLPPSGEAKALIGCGGGLCTEDPAVGGTIYPIYWRPY